MTGYVFKVRRCPGFFGILHYGERTTVYVRAMNATSVRDACSELSSRFAGRFVPADRDQEAWGRTILKVRPSAPMLTG